MMAIAQKLEAYTLKHPEEVLLVTVMDDQTEDQIIIFKGFSSSLMHPTNFNPDDPVIRSTAQILSIDRLQSPYQPNNPIYLERNLSLAQMTHYLQAAGIN